LPGTWEEALLLLHRRGWRGELIDEACGRIVEACGEGELAGRPVGGLAAEEIAAVLTQPLGDAESRALARVCEVHERADAQGHSLREALRDLDAFVDSLGAGA
jgi:hypothetical protein